MAGDEEEPCLEANLMLKRAIPTAGLAVLPKSGHGINLEEPALFNPCWRISFRRWRRDAGAGATRARPSHPFTGRTERPKLPLELPGKRGAVDLGPVHVDIRNPPGVLAVIGRVRFADLP